MGRKKKSVFAKNKDEIKFEIINSCIAGSLVFLGSMTAGFSVKGICLGAVAGLIVFVTKFQKYWTTQRKEYKRSLTLFAFI